MKNINRELLRIILVKFSLIILTCIFIIITPLPILRFYKTPRSYFL
jgi:hypothetical protein